MHEQYQDFPTAVCSKRGSISRAHHWHREEDLYAAYMNVSLRHIYYHYKQDPYLCNNPSAENKILSHPASVTPKHCKYPPLCCSDTGVGDTLQPKCDLHRDKRDTPASRSSKILFCSMFAASVTTPYPPVGFLKKQGINLKQNQKTKREWKPFGFLFCSLTCVRFDETTKHRKHRELVRVKFRVMLWASLQAH